MSVFSSSALYFAVKMANSRSLDASSCPWLISHSSNRVFLAECTGNLGNVGASVALRLVGHLHYNGTHYQTSGNNLAQILSGSELSGVLAGDASALHLAQFKGVGYARYRSEMSQHL